MSYTIGICDDEPYWQHQILNYCQCMKKKKALSLKIHLFSSGEQLLKEDKKLDILFLDEEMKDISGQMVKEVFEQKHFDTMLIFVTSHTEILFDSFGKNVYGFLEKPIVPEKFFKLFDKVLTKLQQDPFIMIPDSILGEQKIFYKEIIYVEACGSYSKIVLEHTKEFSISKNLAELETIFDFPYLIRVHKSYLVNLYQPCKLAPDTSYLITKTELKIPIARRRKKEVRSLYLERTTNLAKQLWDC